MSDAPRKRLPLRFLTLAEIVGVVAVVVAVLGYWDSHRERTQEAREKALAARERQVEARANTLKQAFLMTGAPEGSGDRIRLSSLRDEQVIQTQTIWFPKDIRAASVETTGNPRLEVSWIEDGLRKARTKEGRVPVGVLTVFIEDGQTKTDRAVYQVGYSLHARTLRKAKVELDGLSLARRGVTGDLQAAADNLWTAR
ncbi:hypothetical protein JKL49_08930 [Phenylobacterium sp. 20VBR1]|uniref:Uncharacterized protein n=1 Tax=Phenylobacterium glaciei TaxID=2803784 RepID=A0A941D3E7_9CAUL|nr:hypothetical protein [Phenylobacterium glaciei]MBR7619508.1 hypothetical protein [Phenylobacterium glaciei]